MLNGSDTPDVDFRFTWGHPIQLAAMEHLTIHCRNAERYPAKKLNAKFAGQAQARKCAHVSK